MSSLRMTGMSSGLDIEGMISSIMSASEDTYNNYVRSETYLGWQQEAYRSITTSMQSFQSKWFGSTISNNLGYETAWNKYTASVTDKNGNSSSAIKVNSTTDTGSYQMTVEQMAQSEKITASGSISGSTDTSISKSTSLTDALGGDFDEVFGDNVTLNGDGAVVLNFGGKDITVNESDTIQSFMDKVNKSGADVTMDFNQLTNRFSIESNESGLDNSINIEDTNTLEFLKTIHLDIEAAQTDSDAYVASGGAYVAGQNAIFTVDGVTVERSSNDVEMNGINFTITGVTESAVTLGSSVDADFLYNRLVEFVDDYNSLVKEIEALVDTPRITDSDGYIQPLTSEEMIGLSGTEIEYWEEQAKTGLLHNDSILSGFLSDLRGLIYQSVDIGNGSSLSLYQIGITTTSDWTTDVLEIDEDKLRGAIETMGDDIAKMFTATGDGVADKMQSVLNKYIGSNGYLRNKAGISGTISDTDNTMTTALADIREKITAELEKLSNKEDSLYTQFARMEQVMSQQNANMGMLMSSLG